MALRQSAAEILSQLIHLTDQLDEQQYVDCLPALSGSSIGKHVRHIIEFYECLLNALQSGTVNYDARIRNVLLETDPFFSTQVMFNIIQQIENQEEDLSLSLQLDISLNDAAQQEMHTTYNRELAYNIEHAIHHMAIIKMAVLIYFSNIKVEENFGVAYSTIRYREKVFEK